MYVLRVRTACTHCVYATCLSVPLDLGAVVDALLVPEGVGTHHDERRDVGAERRRHLAQAAARQPPSAAVGVDDHRQPAASRLGT